MLLVQEYLQDHSFADLENEHGIYCSFSKSGHKWSLNYSMIEAKDDDLLAQECRGLILALPDGRSVFGEKAADGKLDRSNIEPGITKVLAYPMRRFYNFGQGAAAKIDWNDPQLNILEKLDGTLCIVYWDPFTDQWCVATRSVPEADLLMYNGLFTFRSLFEKAMRETTGLDFASFISKLDQNHTYCFELTTPLNRIVCDYRDYRITLLAARDMITHLEVYPEQCNIVLEGIVPVVQSYAPTSVSDLVSWVVSRDPLQHEGIVVRDRQFNRIKVKNPAHSLFNKMRDSLGTSERNCMQLILLGKDDDIVSFMPEEIVQNIRKLKDGLARVIKEHDQAYQFIFDQTNQSNPGDKKTFALAVNDVAKQMGDKLYTAYMFSRWSGKCSNLHDFLIKNCKDGIWSDSFLDRLLDLAKLT